MSSEFKTEKKIARITFKHVEYGEILSMMTLLTFHIN